MLAVWLLWMDRWGELLDPRRKDEREWVREAWLLQGVLQGQPGCLRDGEMELIEEGGLHERAGSQLLAGLSRLPCNCRLSAPTELLSDSLEADPMRLGCCREGGVAWLMAKQLLRGSSHGHAGWWKVGAADGLRGGELPQVLLLLLGLAGSCRVGEAGWELKGLHGLVPAS